MRTTRGTPVIIIDTREQKPYKFRGMDRERKGLETGDYSLKGHEDKVVVERKSHADAWDCARGSRKRFVNCLQRLAVLPHPAIVIECTLEELSQPTEHVITYFNRRYSSASRRYNSKEYIEKGIKGAIQTVVSSYISWSQQYRIPVFFAGNRAYSERLVVKFLMSYWRHEVICGVDYE